MVNVDGEGDVAVRGSSWYQRMSAHVAHLQGQLNKFVALRVQAGGISSADKEIVTKTTAHLNAARTALQGPEGRRIRRRMSGAPADRALANMHEAEVALLRIAPREELRNKGFYALSHAWLHLGRDEELPRQLEAALYRGGPTWTLRRGPGSWRPSPCTPPIRRRRRSGRGCAASRTWW